MAGIPYGILPALLILPVVWKKIHNELVELSQSEHLAWRILNCHIYQRYVAAKNNKSINNDNKILRNKRCHKYKTVKS